MADPLNVLRPISSQTTNDPLLSTSLSPNSNDLNIAASNTTDSFSFPSKQSTSSSYPFPRRDSTNKSLPYQPPASIKPVAANNYINNPLGNPNPSYNNISNNTPSKVGTSTTTTNPLINNNPLITPPPSQKSHTGITPITPIINKTVTVKTTPSINIKNNPSSPTLNNPMSSPTFNNILHYNISNTNNDDDIKDFFNANLPNDLKININDIALNLNGLKKLFNNGRYRDVVELSDKILSSSKISSLLSTENNINLSEEESFNIRCLLLLSLAWLARFDRLEKEFVLLEALKFDIPFDVKLLKMEIKGLKGEYSGTISQLVELYGNEREDSVHYNAISMKLIHYYLMVYDYPSALMILENVKLHPSAPLIKLSVLISMGNIEAAELFYSEVESVFGPEISLFKSCIMIGKHQFQEAFDLLTEVAENFMESPMFTQWLNNYSVAAMFSNNLHVAIVTIEDFIRNNPYKAARDLNLINSLTTMYTVASPKPEFKKKILERIVLLYGEDKADH